MGGTEPGDLTDAGPDQERLRESEERLRLLVEGVEDYAIFMLDPDGTVVSWNSGAERMKGYRSEEICGEHFSRFYPAEDVRAGKPAEELRTATALGRVEDEGWRVRKDGSQFWASVLITALRGPDGRLRGFGKVTRDFTERRRLEEQLRTQASLLERVYDAVVATDRDDRLIGWNDGARRLYGWRAEEVLGKPVDVLATEFSESTRDDAHRVLEEGGEWRGEVVQRHKSGRYVEVEAAIIVLSEGPTRMVSINRDIAERKRALVIEERGRIARDLHDSVSQALFSITLQTRGLELAIQAEGHDPTGSLGSRAANIRRLTQGALAEMRALIFELRPDALAGEGLVAALRRHAAAVEAREGVVVNISASAEDVSLDPAVEENLHRLVQEALNNVVRHAQASTVHVRLAWDQTDPGGLELEITDDGIGFDPGVSRPGHLGLTSMSERAARLGATLQVTSAPGRGTTIRAAVPIRGANP